LFIKFIPVEVPVAAQRRRGILRARGQCREDRGQQTDQNRISVEREEGKTHPSWNPERNTPQNGAARRSAALGTMRFNLRVFSHEIPA
jgi:hypothetical protein